MIGSFVRNLDDLVFRVANGKNQNHRQEGRSKKNGEIFAAVDFSFGSMHLCIHEPADRRKCFVSLCASIDQIRKDVKENNMEQAQWKRLLTRLKKGLKKVAIKQLHACDDPGLLHACWCNVYDRDLERGELGPTKNT